MESSKPQFRKYIFVCENQREEGACCAPQGVRLCEILKEAIQKLGLAKKVRVSWSGCLDVCAEGPNVLLMPDNLWFKYVEEKDIPSIIDRAIQ